MAEKVTTMVLSLNVDLQCSKCFKKVKKLLCKFPEIRDQVYDEKANKVTIKVICCSPEKIMDKLCCKGGGCIKSIEIKEPEKPKPKVPEKKPEKAKEEPKKRPDKPKTGGDPPRDPPAGQGSGASNLRYPPPAPPVIGFWCSEGFSHSGMPAGNPRCPVQYDGYY